MKARHRQAKIFALRNMITNDNAASADEPRGVEHAGVIDFLGYDSTKGEVVLKIVEKRPWDGSELQLFQLQEKLNAYMSFILDGEMSDAFPQFAEKPVRLRLECVNPPHPEAVAFLQAVYDQSALQGVAFEVEAMGKLCGCGKPQESCGKE